MSYVYLLVSTKGNTYVGATVDLNRRLRQHNKEIKGGAEVPEGHYAQENMKDTVVPNRNKIFS